MSTVDDIAPIHPKRSKRPKNGPFQRTRLRLAVGHEAPILHGTRRKLWDRDPGVGIFWAIGVWGWVTSGDMSKMVRC